ncbi:MAG: hypothetical protein PHU12_04775, partial [Candidatus Aenigmarchaeota archaeon]|nr:hypothetical protein [Candidatus Aenigmarchaeota archaeon]
MVLESIFGAETLEKKPYDMLILSMIVTLVCVYVSYMIFPEYAGIIMPLLITVAMTPVIFRVFKIEEEGEREEAEHLSHKTFWDRHDDTIIMFTMFFIGVFIAVFFITLVKSDQIIEQAF